MSKSYNKYVAQMQSIADIQYGTALLHWDMETYMPIKGAALRARQISTLSQLAHKKATTGKLGKLLNKCKKKSLSGLQAINIDRSLEDYNKAIKLPGQFVGELSHATSKAYMAWIEARKQDNYKVFEPALSELIILKKKEAEYLGYTQHPYDALLDNFEPGCTVSFLDKLFKVVRNQLVPFVAEVRAADDIDSSFLKKYYPRDKQWDFGLMLLKQMGYDFEAGRQDISEHPFTINFGPEDVRITTRIDENDFSNMTWSCIHEGGHALYEQGLPADQYGLPGGSAASLAIHESQSRLWENMIGRSRDFWVFNFPKLQEVFTENLSDITLDHFYQAINKVKAGPIRTEADELHYHFHVMIRYEIEKGIFDETLKVSELKEYWNSKYKEYLDLDIQSDKKGILQDIHWSHGSFGYFPTYSLGSFYAAQFFDAYKNQTKGYKTEISEAKFDNLLHWLRENIHTKGRQLYPNELCREITGKELDFSYFMNYAKEKYPVTKR